MFSSVAYDSLHTLHTFCSLVGKLGIDVEQYRNNERQNDSTKKFIFRRIIAREKSKFVAVAGDNLLQRNDS